MIKTDLACIITTGRSGMYEQYVQFLGLRHRNLDFPCARAPVHCDDKSHQSRSTTSTSYPDLIVFFFEIYISEHEDQVASGSSLAGF